ncbi:MULTISPECIES: response regulator transcription factor [Petrotoga]|uniref:Two-component system OmpR family response regulator n=2 Tax=Petrotoga sibirica TaxID=156202 RepID=A0A4R8EGU2_9BACT|nr:MULTISPECIES: response regulator transcription factor [Petrotoga]KUK81696.1 MAG: Two component transcriptional regulator, winged helix family [Petrotoga mobilis]POZ87795.1 transcriptional regulator [Petrotoga sibirica DSM 13575]POZ89835.1 transcriptional regulator [Petrotoga sp. SL27]TDX11104.1 two-component system OmpR family response regulator [Petrotoga sibirica]
MPKVLIVEDDEDIRDILKTYLRLEDLEIFEAGTLSQMRNVLNKESNIDIILLDLMLPDGDAVNELPKVRALNREIGIIIISAKNTDGEKILGIESGADDYITKPFNPREVTARVRALLKRLKKSESKMVFGPMEIYSNNYLVTYKGKNIELTSKEFEILDLLARNSEKVYTREEIIDKIWFGDEFITDRVIDVHISMIRSKIGKDWIKTIRNVGYKFNKNAFTVDNNGENKI